jgi:hypothetical protein
MVVLADEVLESFFESDFSATFKLEPIFLEESPTSNSGFLSGLWSNIATDDNKKIFNKLSDEVGRTIGKHQVCHPIQKPFTRLTYSLRLSTDRRLGDIRHWKSRKLEKAY